MTSVRFYLHDQTGTLAKLDMACRLLRKIYTSDNQAYVLMGDAEAAASLDDAFWVYEPTAFIPHSLADAKDDEQLNAPIQIGTYIPKDAIQNRLVNLSDEMPDSYDRFEQVLEIVGGEPEAKESARLRYKNYQDAGCEMLKVHKESEITSTYFRSLASPI